MTDIGFWVVNGIVALAAKRVYDGALVKKRRYWPKDFQGISPTVFFRKGCRGCRHNEGLNRRW